MTGEEMERAIDSLIKIQANLEAQVVQVNANLGARIEEVDRRLGARAEETERQLAETNRQLAGTNRQLEENGRQLDECGNMLTTFIQVVTRTFEAQAVINKRTDERLNAVINTVERLISERGGKP